MSILAVPVALAAAVCFASASALQHRAASREPRHQAVDLGLLLRLVRRPLWLAGGVADIAAVGLQALALDFGALTLVEPLLVSGLFLAVPFEAALDRRWPHRRDLVAVVLAAAGLAAFLLTATPGGGVSEPSNQAWLPTGVAVVSVIMAILVLAWHATAPRRATCLGLATGMAYGVTAGLLKTCTDRLADGPPLGLLTGWPLYALVGLGAAAFVLNQDAFQGRLAAPLIAITLAEPTISIVIGVTVFDERLSTTGPRSIVLVLSAAAMVAGTWLAAGGPPIRDRHRGGDGRGDSSGGQPARANCYADEDRLSLADLS